MNEHFVTLEALYGIIVLLVIYYPYYIYKKYI